MISFRLERLSVCSSGLWLRKRKLRQLRRNHPLRFCLPAWIVAAFLLMVLAPGAAQAQQPAMSPADRSAFRHALAEIDAGKSGQAEPALQRLAALYPADDRVNEALGLTYAESGDLTQALPYLQRACRSAPRSAADHVNLGTAWLRLGHAGEAADELKTAARLEPQNAGALSKLGQAYMLMQDPANAVDAFARAAVLKPPDPDLLYNWAVALDERGETQHAAVVLKRIPAIQMSDEAESLAGELQEKLGRYLLAVQHYQAAAQKNPSEANLYALCVEFLRHWTWDQARQTAEYGVAKYPGSMRLKLASGVAYFGSKDFADAVKVFAGLLQQDPDNSTYADMLGRACGEFATGNPDCDALHTFARKHPENAAAAFYAARQILDRPHTEADLDEAQQLLTKATAADPRLADAWYETGVLDAERRLWKESAGVLQKAISLRPGFPSAHYQLAIAYGHLNRPEDRKKELALFQACSRQEKDELNARLREMTIFLTKSQ